MFLECAEKMQVDKVVFENDMVNSNILDSPHFVRRSLWRTVLHDDAVTAAFTTKASQLEHEKFKPACCMFA